MANRQLHSVARQRGQLRPGAESCAAAVALRSPAGASSSVFLYPVATGTVPPHITGPDSEQVTTTLNSSVSLPCDVRAHPGPEVTWYKDGQALSLGEGAFLLPGG